MKLRNWKPKDPAWPAPVRERVDGLRVHLGGFIRGPDGETWSSCSIRDTTDPRWRLALVLEPTLRRALMTYADMRWPVAAPR